MRHYEIVALVHPDNTELQDKIVKRYCRFIEDSGGKVHRCEDWGRRKLAYPIQKIFKAGYFLMNVECEPATKTRLENMFRYNDSIIRSLIIRMDGPVTEESPVLKKIIKKKAEEKEEAERIAAEAAEARAAEEAKKAKLAEEEAEAKADEESETKADEEPETKADEAAGEEPAAAADAEQSNEASEEAAASAEEAASEEQDDSGGAEETEPGDESDSKSEEAKS